MNNKTQFFLGTDWSSILVHEILEIWK